MAAPDVVDVGLLGPGSVAWRVVGHPMSLVGGMRALMVQALHPLAMAGVAQHSDYEHRAMDRLRRTAYYVTATTFGDTPTAYAAAERVKRLHRRIRGVDPVTGKRYSAEDHDLQIWVHCTEWHSFLASYRVFGSSITPEQQDQYLAEGVEIGSLLGAPRERIPASRDQYRDYFAAVRPQLCVSEAARKAITFVRFPPLERDNLHLQPIMRMFGSAAVALIPGYLRTLAGIARPPWVDIAAINAARPFGTALTLPIIRELPRSVIGSEARAIGVRARELIMTHSSSN
jgi:uncharacterized protein (DUF2236 family)